MKLPITGKKGIDSESIPLFGLSIIGTIFLALASYRLLEIHFLRLKNLYQPPIRAGSGKASGSRLRPGLSPDHTPEQPDVRLP